MVFAGMSTCDEGVQAFDLVDEPMPRQKIQGPIRYGWLTCEPSLAKHVQNCVGAKGPMFLQQQLQNFASDGRKAQASFATPFLCSQQGSIHTMIVIMQLEPKRRLSGC